MLFAEYNFFLADNTEQFGISGKAYPFNLQLMKLVHLMGKLESYKLNDDFRTSKYFQP